MEITGLGKFDGGGSKRNSLSMEVQAVLFDLSHSAYLTPRDPRLDSSTSACTRPSSGNAIGCKNHPRFSPCSKSFHRRSIRLNFLRPLFFDCRKKRFLLKVESRLEDATVELLSRRGWVG